MAGKRRTWKLSDTVAAVFFGLLLVSLPFRPWLGGLEILAMIVGVIWALSLWANAVHGEYVPPLLSKEDKEMMRELEETSQRIQRDIDLGNL